MGVEMNYCMQCGTRLRRKHHETEGEIPYCDTCGDYRFPVFNTAVSMIVVHPDREHFLLIQQYGRPFYILCAGYVNQGEGAEEAAIREIREELGLEVETLRFNRSRYFAPSNTLMLNFTAIIQEASVRPNWEIDAWRWFTGEEARQQIKPGSLAAFFLESCLAEGNAKE